MFRPYVHALTIWKTNQKFFRMLVLIGAFIPLWGCAKNHRDVQEHEVFAMETGLMEVSVCATTDEGLLVPIIRRVASGNDYSLSALNLLVASPENSMFLSSYGLSAPLPQDAQISTAFAEGILSVEVNHLPEGITSANSIQAIQATALSLPGVAQVQLALDGAIWKSSSDNAPTDAMTAQPHLNPMPLPVFSHREALVAVTLYYPLGETTLFGPLTTYFSEPLTTIRLLETLMKTEPSEGLANPFPKDIFLISVAETDEGLLLDFNDALLNWMQREEKQFQGALDSIWHTVRAYQPVKKLILSVGGYPVKTYVGGELNQIP